MRVAGSPDPIGDLFQNLGENSMSDQVQLLLRPWLRNGVVFNFRVPSDLEAMTKSSSARKGIRDLDQKSSRGSHDGGGQKTSGSKDGAQSRGKPGGSSGGRGASGKHGTTESPQWVINLPESERVASWSLPPGRKLGEFFNPSKKGNQEGIPEFQHHRLTNRTAPICVKHQVGTCNRGADCTFSHVLPSRLSTEKFRAVTEKLNAIYADGGGPSA